MNAEPERGLRQKAGLVVLGTGSRALADIILAVVLVRLLTRVEYGEFRQIILILGSISLISGLGLPASVFYFIPRLPKSQTGHFVRRLLRILALAGIASAALVVILAPAIANAFHHPPLASLLRLAAVLPIGQVLTLVLPNALIAWGRHGEASIWRGITGVLQAICAVTPVILGFGVQGALIGLTTFWLVAGVTSYMRMRNLSGPALKPAEDVGMSVLLKYSVPLSLNSSLGILNQRMDRFLVGFFFAPEIFALFAVGATEIPLVGLLTYSIGSMLIPEFARMDSEGSKDKILLVWHKSIQRICLIVMPAFVFLFIFSEDVIVALFTEEYRSATWVFRIFLLLLPLRVASYGSILQSLGHTRRILLATIIGFIVNLVVGISLVPVMGWTGPACGAVVAQLVMIVYLVKGISRALEAPFRDIFPIWIWSKSLALAAVCILPVILIAYWDAEPVLRLAAGGAAFTLIFLSALWRLGWIDRRELQFFKIWD